jgi:hypothetical protein
MNMSRGRAHFTETDVARILKAAVKAGTSVSIEFSSGEIARVTAASGIAAVMTSSRGNPWDQAIVELTARSS